MNKTKNQDWKTMLKQLKLDHIKDTAAGFFYASGGYSMAVKPYTDKTANGLTRCIIDFLTFSGHYAVRVGVQGQARVKNIDRYSIFTRKVETIGKKVTWTKSSTRRGTPDINGVVASKSISLEVKIGQDSMSGEQLREKLKIEAAGGLYLVATSFPQFHDWYCRTFSTHNKTHI